MTRARSFLEEEDSTAPSRGPPEDPGISFTPLIHPLAAAASTQLSDLNYLRKDFPAISHWPDEMLRAHPIGELARAHANWNLN